MAGSQPGRWGPQLGAGSQRVKRGELAGIQEETESLGSGACKISVGRSHRRWPQETPSGHGWLGYGLEEVLVAQTQPLPAVCLTLTCRKHRGCTQAALGSTFNVEFYNIPDGSRFMLTGATDPEQSGFPAIYAHRLPLPGLTGSGGRGAVSGEPRPSPQGGTKANTLGSPEQACACVAPPPRARAQP